MRLEDDTDPMDELEAADYGRLETGWAADAEMAEMTRVGDATARAQARGICTHGSAAGYMPPGREAYPEQHGLLPGQLACTENRGGCVRVFDNDEEWMAAMDAAIRGQ